MGFFSLNKLSNSWRYKAIPHHVKVGPKLFIHIPAAGRALFGLQELHLNPISLSEAMSSTLRLPLSAQPQPQPPQETPFSPLCSGMLHAAFPLQAGPQTRSPAETSCLRSPQSSQSCAGTARGPATPSRCVLRPHSHQAAVTTGAGGGQPQKGLPRAGIHLEEL